MKIELTQHEQAIFAALLDFDARTNGSTVFRAAGGWVRDRLLGKACDDIDIAIDNMTGSQFAERYVAAEKALGRKGAATYIIAANPDKSKHLETVGIKLLDQKIDIVNLRTETYGDSRIPTMEMGTAQSDAERRDLTINALFYNLNTGEVEDFVGGLEDLKTLTLRTPLEPKKTFMDDPLRVLRAFRFFSVIEGSVFDPALLAAVADPEVQEAYRTKVSPERAGPELLKLMAGKRPALALRKMFECGFDAALFTIPEMKWVDIRMNQNNKHHAFNLLEHTLRVVEGVERLVKDEPTNVRVAMLFAALFHDFGKAVAGIATPKEKDPTEFSYLGHEEASEKISESFLKQIGVPEKDRAFANKVILLHMRVHAEKWSNKSIGKFIRESQIPGQEEVLVWKFVFLHGIADALAKGTEDATSDAEAKSVWMEKFAAFKEKLGKGVNVPKPFLNGFALMKLFPNLKPSKTIVFESEDEETKEVVQVRKNFIAFISDLLLDEQAEGRIADETQATNFVEGMRQEVETKFM